MIGSTNYVQPLGSSRRNSLSENNIKLLPGESFVTKAQNVLMFSPVSDLNQGTSGILSVTNFKLTFVTTDETNGDVSRFFRSLLSPSVLKQL